MKRRRTKTRTTTPKIADPTIRNRNPEMNTPTELSAILGKKPSDIPEPQPLPNGIYVVRIDEVGQAEQRGQNKNWCVDFNLTILQAVDVQLGPDELPRRRRLTKWLTEDSLFYFGKFLGETLGIEESGRTLMEMLPEARGRMFKVEIKQKPYETRSGETRMGNEFGREFHLDADVG
jgi:hypothetical protein